MPSAVTILTQWRVSFLLFCLVAIDVGMELEVTRVVAKKNATFSAAIAKEDVDSRCYP